MSTDPGPEPTEDMFSQTWNALCKDPDCVHPRYAHAGRLGENPCKAGSCTCPWFIDFDPTHVRVGYYDSPRFWYDPKDECDPAWYHRLGVPYLGADEWGRRTITIRVPFAGYLSWAYRTCWCQDCHAGREQTYRLQREEWKHVSERANQDRLQLNGQRYMYEGKPRDL